MAMTAGNLIDRAAKLAQDETNIRWPRTEWMDYLNDAQREVVMYKPDASSVVANMSLVSGTLQSIPAGGIKLLDVVRCMGPAGSTPGRAVRLVDREVLDAQIPSWHSSVSSLTPVHYMLDWRTPTKFYVYPPAATPSTVEIVYAVSPTDCAGEGSALSINEIYANALLNYMLFRAYSKDAEYAANPQMASQYYQLFAGEVGAKTNADRASAPIEGNQANPNVMQQQR